MTQKKQVSVPLSLSASPSQLMTDQTMGDRKACFLSQSSASISKQVILAIITVQLALASFQRCQSRLTSAQQAVTIQGGHNLLQAFHSPHAAIALWMCKQRMTNSNRAALSFQRMLPLFKQNAAFTSHRLHRNYEQLSVENCVSQLTWTS